MSRFVQNFLVLFLVVVLGGGNERNNFAAASCLGCIALDDITFAKTIARYPFALVKFDIAFPYDHRHEAYAKFVTAAHQATDDLLLATVGIKDYGTNENQALGHRFGVVAGNPSIILFKANADTFIKMSSSINITHNSLHEFMSNHTSYYIDLDGRMREFNELAKDFVSVKQEEQMERIRFAKELMAQLPDDDTKQRSNANIYVVFMERIHGKGVPYIGSESKRLNGLINDGNMSDKKRDLLQRKHNILTSFALPSKSKDEL